MQKKDDELMQAALKKALGYVAIENTEESVLDEDGQARIVKHKTVSKDVPPDVSALKLLLERQPEEGSMTDEELEAEKQRLIGLLKKGEEE